MVFLSPLLCSMRICDADFIFFPSHQCVLSRLHLCVYMWWIALCHFFSTFFFSYSSCNVMVWLNPVFRLNKSPHSTTHTIDYDICNGFFSFLNLLLTLCIHLFIISNRNMKLGWGSSVSLSQFLYILSSFYSVFCSISPLFIFFKSPFRPHNFTCFFCSCVSYEKKKQTNKLVKL